MPYLVNDEIRRWLTGKTIAIANEIDGVVTLCFTDGTQIEMHPAAEKQQWMTKQR